MQPEQPNNQPEPSTAGCEPAEPATCERLVRTLLGAHCWVDMTFSSQHEAQRQALGTEDR